MPAPRGRHNKKGAHGAWRFTVNTLNSIIGWLRIIIIISIACVVVIFAGLIYILWGFWLEFIGLSIVYVGIFLLIILGIRAYYKDNHWTYWDYLWNKKCDSNNNWFYLLMGATMITFVIALFHFGPALALPTNQATGVVYHDATNVLQHILFGNQAGKMGLEPPSNILPWATGTWFWWKATGLYLLLTLLYFPFAFWDEGVAMIHFVKEEIQKHHDAALKKKRTEHADNVKKVQEANSKRKKGEPEIPAPNPPPDKLHFEEFMEWGVAIEIFFAVVKFIKEMKEA
jgi:hypothetical protein